MEVRGTAELAEPEGVSAEVSEQARLNRKGKAN
jgi:hypothetical protein